MLSLTSPKFHVARELIFCFMPNSFASEVSFDLYDCRSGFYIDPSAVSDWRLKEDLCYVTFFKLERCRENKLTYVCLYFGFSPPVVPPDQSRKQFKQIAPPPKACRD